MSAKRNRMMKRNRKRRQAEYRRILSTVWNERELDTLTPEDVEYLGRELAAELAALEQAEQAEREQAEREQAEQERELRAFQTECAERKRVGIVG
ncbi:MAG: hypothetical protein GY906_12775 [bacterium]|nr:hypothetical protein [bacterium]